MKLNKGFTLIELLVVISIIGLLSSVVLASLNTARGKSRDSQRKQTLLQLKNAIELYHLANNAYPPVGVAGYWNGYAAPGTCDDVGSDWYRQSNSWISGLVPNYIPSLPIDPSYANTDTCSGYIYFSNGASYKLMSYLKVEEGNVAGGKPFSRMGPNCPGASLPDWWDTNNNNINDDAGQRVYAIYGGATPGYECS